MSKGVLVTVTWKIKPELVDTCVDLLRNMFPTTRLKKGFRNIRLLRSEVHPDEFILVQEWDEVQDHIDYMQFRTETGDIGDGSQRSTNRVLGSRSARRRASLV